MYIFMVYALEMLHLINGKNLNGREDKDYLMQTWEDFGLVDKMEHI